MKPKPLTRAQRSMLHNALTGKPLHQGLRATAVTHRPTAAGRAVLLPPGT